MYFEQFYLGCLAHASYMAGSEGIAVVVDPQRDVEIYLEAARLNGLRIAYVIETHLHADFVSGHRELAARTGAQIYVGASAGAQFPHVAVRDGDEIRFGRCHLQFLETPGHTLESLCVLVTDLDRSPDPCAVLTGDTLFIGDVGRPDLSPGYTPQQLAGFLYDSLHQKLLRLPDDLRVYPAHGAGSLCGRQLSTERSSTIGEQRRTNYALQAATRDEFVRLLTETLPDRPAYFARDAEINRTGAPALGELPSMPELTVDAFARLRQSGALVLDTRPDTAFAAAYIPGSVNIPLAGQFASWAGALLGLEADLVLLAENPDCAVESRMRLARVGIERVAGYLAGGIEAWRRANRPVGRLPHITVQDLDRLRREDAALQIADVRRPAEWDDGHIAGALLLPLNQFPAAVGQLDPARPVVVHCKGGYRSAIAASLLRRAGFSRVMNVTGGFDAWNAAGLSKVAQAALV
ncbi:MAG: rhodanese-like domain-containing protein [Bryobacteraceae bacterium]|jgi:glyoxylase-like metal-dependent hydrolase (beta-lactamase superfamily II)/rhodanese-related sulfurtransferase